MATRSVRTVRRIGTVTSKHGDAWLGEDGVWRAELPALAESLNLLHSPFAAGHSAKYGFGLQAVRDAAVFLKGTASFPTVADA